MNAKPDWFSEANRFHNAVSRTATLLRAAVAISDELDVRGPQARELSDICQLLGMALEIAEQAESGADRKVAEVDR